MFYHKYRFSIDEFVMLSFPFLVANFIPGNKLLVLNNSKIENNKNKETSKDKPNKMHEPAGEHEREQNNGLNN